MEGKKWYMWIWAKGITVSVRYLQFCSYTKCYYIITNSERRLWYISVANVHSSEARNADKFASHNRIELSKFLRPMNLTYASGHP